MTSTLKRFASLPVVGVLLLIGFIYHTVTFLVVEPWMGLSTAPGLFNVLLFTFLASMTLFCYVLAVLRDPGRVPSSYMPDFEDSGTIVHEVKRKQGGDHMRYCQKCGHYKPPRTHHCRTCKRCVLRMDHHCVWINNCVGHNNYKAFFLFVWYVVAACVHALLLLGAYALQEFGGDALDNSDILPRSLPGSSSISLTALLKVLCAVVMIPLLIAVTTLLSWHIFLMLQNKTTIEYHEGVRALWLAEKAGQQYKHPYDLGTVANLVVLLGPSPTHWLWPTAIGHIGSGLQFHSSYDPSTHAESHSGG